MYASDSSSEMLLTVPPGLVPKADQPSARKDLQRGIQSSEGLAFADNVVQKWTDSCKGTDKQAEKLFRAARDYFTTCPSTQRRSTGAEL